MPHERLFPVHFFSIEKITTSPCIPPYIRPLRLSCQFTFPEKTACAAFTRILPRSYAFIHADLLFLSDLEYQEFSRFYGSSGFLRKIPGFAAQTVVFGDAFYIQRYLRYAYCIYNILHIECKRSITAWAEMRLWISEPLFPKTQGVVVR